MKKVFENLDKNRVVGFATVDMDGNPSNRNFQILELFRISSGEAEIFRLGEKPPTKSKFSY